MRSRIVSRALCVSALVVCFTQSVAAQPAPLSDQKQEPVMLEEVVYRTDAVNEDRKAPESEPSRAAWWEETEAENNTCDGCGSEGGDCGCDSAGCAGSCFDDCNTCCAPFGLAAGVEATYLKPSFSDNESGIYSDFDYEYEAAPRVWLQWQAQSGWGIRGRYWDFDADQGQAGMSDSDDTVAAVSIVEDLDVSAVDLELTRAFSVAQTDCWVSLGARHGRLMHFLTQQLTVFDLSGGGGDDATAIFQQIDSGFEGTGVTAALDLRRPIMQSRLAAVCNLRGSYLWGTNELDVRGAIIEVVPVGAGDLDLNDFEDLQILAEENDGMWIGELQAGAEWNTPISASYGGGNAFIRVLFEAQWWNLPGISASRGLSTQSLVHELMGVTAAVGISR